MQLRALLYMSIPGCQHVAIDFVTQETMLNTQGGGFVYLPVPGTNKEVQAQFCLMCFGGVIVVIVSFVLIFTL